MTITYTGYKSDRTGIYIEKDTESTLDYSIDWSEWLPAGITITGSSWAIGFDGDDTDPVARVSDVFTGDKTTITVSGGTVNEVYRLFNTVTLSSGLVERRSFRILVTQREV
jgi:hypothetical protein